MGSLSNYAELKWLDHALKTTSYSQPTNLYIGLSTADPTDAGSGIAEPSGMSYARVAHNVWATAASRVTSNTGTITFAAASGTWGTITHWFIVDASTGGNMIAYGALTVSNSVVSGNVVVFGTGQITITVNTGTFSNYLANKMLDHQFKNTAYTPATNLYVGLSTANPGDSGSGLAEPSGSAYARVNKNTWDPAAVGATENTGAITFPTATGSWGTCTHSFIADASTSGNILFYGALGSSQAVVNGNIVEYDDGALDLTLD